MRYPASEKAEIIELVERSHLPAKRTLNKLGIPECFRLEWREHGGPLVKPAKRIGFGSFVIDRMVNSTLNAKVEIELATEGLRLTLNMPASQVERAQENVQSLGVPEG